MIEPNKVARKKIQITDSFEDLKLKVGEKVELYSRVWQYGETRDKQNVVTSRFLDPL